MLIEQFEKNNKGKFYIGDVNQPQAEMEYAMKNPSTLVIIHTEVSDALRGKNVGFQLVNHVVEYARTNNLKIIPLCPFAKSVFEKRPEFADLLLNPIKKED